MIKNCLGNIILGFSAYSDVKVAYFSEEEPK